MSVRTDTECKATTASVILLLRKPKNKAKKRSIAFNGGTNEVTPPKPAPEESKWNVVRAQVHKSPQEKPRALAQVVQELLED